MHFAQINTFYFQFSEMTKEFSRKKDKKKKGKKTAEDSEDEDDMNLSDEEVYNVHGLVHHKKIFCP